MKDKESETRRARSGAAIVKNDLYAFDNRPGAYEEDPARSRGAQLRLASELLAADINTTIIP